MFHINVRKAAQLCGGTLSTENGADAEITRCVRDNREVQPGDLFVCFRGARVDGHAFMGNAFEKGASCCLGEYVPEGETRPVIVVEDVLAALTRLASAFRSELTIPVIGVTGSVGKTTAKEMISSVLSEGMNTYKTRGNLNNEIGVPLTISEIREEHEAAIVEMGINHFGEMTRLAKTARPDIAVYTVIGRAHWEFLHDYDGVLKAKTEMLDYMPEDGIIILNGDDAKLATVRNSRKILRYGFGAECEVRASDVNVVSSDDCRFRVNYEERSFEVRVNAYGEQMIYAALEGVAVGLVMRLTEEQICAGVRKYQPADLRAQVIKTERLNIIVDCYNSNPDSAECLIRSLLQMKGRRVCILGDMLELGPDSVNMHREVGAYAKEKGIDLLIACGPLARDIAEGYGTGAVYFEDLELLKKHISEYLMTGDYVAVKASHALRFENMLDVLEQL